MKKVSYNILFILLFVTTSCTDFLEYKDKDKIIPSSLSDYNELAYSELIYNGNSYELFFLNIMTDDLESVVIPSRPGLQDIDNRINFGNYFKWAIQTQYTLEYKEVEDLTWATAYKRILLCNIIEEEVSKFPDDKNGIKKRLIGESKFIRAMSYFYLINIYGEPYQNEEQAKTALGVPINDQSSINTKIYTRASLEAVCSLIESNLKESILYFNAGENKTTIYRPKADVAKLFLSRLYLYKKEWQKTVDICNDLITNSSATITTRDLLIKLGTVIDNNSKNPGLLSYNNPALLYTWGSVTLDYPISASETSGRAHFQTSESLINLYSNDDIRRTTFFVNNQGLPFLANKRTVKGNNQEARSINYRIEEAYYNRAEAYIEIGDIQKGLDDLNLIRKERFTINSDYKLTSNTQEDARQKMRNEKRREFCFEGLRWFDIRRWNIGITHKYHDFADGNSVTTYELKPGSPNYIMPLPLDLVNKNDKIEQFTRIETIVQ